MIRGLIEWCTAYRFLVFTATALLMIVGAWSMMTMPLDAVPDISDVQVIIATEWPGRSPDRIEDQVTSPLVTASCRRHACARCAA
jgi:Cu(I)/Ag(I) efflux system membrane protein CusA/SilA